MAGSSIFVTYGLKSGGGAPFLKRTRNAFDQRQQRTRTAFTGPQLQTRTRVCNSQRNYMPNIFCGSAGGSSNVSSEMFNQNCNPGATLPAFTPTYNICQGGNANQVWPCYLLGDSEACYDGSNCVVQCGVSASTCVEYNFNFGNWSGYSNTSSCSASFPSCNSRGVTQRECRTIQACQFPNFTDWINTSSCTTANPSCSNGAVIRECRNVFLFREEDWSAFEEADECITSSPTATQGAVAVECIAN